MSEAHLPDGSLRLVGVCADRAERPVLHDVDLTIQSGEVTALLGPNGAGKSTLVLTIAGVVKATSGSVRLDEKDLTNQRPDGVRRAGVAVVPEGRRLLRQLTIAENLVVATYTQPKSDATDGIAKALELFPELKTRLDSPCGLLSGGQQQMVVLAQALAAQPEILIVDELSLGLAPIIVQRLIPTLEAVANEGVGVLLIEQFAHVALELAKSAYVIEGGRIRYDGTSAELQENPELLHSAYLLKG